MGVSKAGASLIAGMEPRKLKDLKVNYPCSFDEAGGSLHSLPCLNDIISSWQRIKTLGEANFGKVYLARASDVAPGVELPEVFALKRMRRGAVLAGGCGLESAQNEILAGLALRGLELPNTARVYFAAQDDDFFYLATEYCEHGELFSVLQGLVSRTKAGMSEGVLREIMGQVLRAVQALHEAGVAHRDISLENLLVTKTGSVRLIDFGQALMVSAGQGCNEAAVRPCRRGPPGKSCYRAPEVMAGVPYCATKADAWACGVLLYTLAVGAYPGADLFPPSELGADRCRMSAYLEKHGLRSRVPPGCQDLLEQLLAPRPAARASVADAAAHPWLVGTLNGLCGPVDVDEVGDGGNARA